MRSCRSDYLQREREKGWNKEEKGLGVYIPMESEDRTLSGATRLCPVGVNNVCWTVSVTRIGNRRNFELRMWIALRLRE
jgi:hypothetical protein